MATETIDIIAGLIGVSTAIATTIIVIISLWEAVWTGLAMWRAAKKNDKLWFWVFLLINILAIPEIIYLIVTRKKEEKSVKKKR